MTDMLVYISTAISNNRFWLLPLLLGCEIIFFIEMVRRDIKYENSRSHERENNAIRNL